MPDSITTKDLQQLEHAMDYMLPETKTLEELNEEAKAGSVYEAPAEQLFSTHAGARC